MELKLFFSVVVLCYHLVLCQRPYNDLRGTFAVNPSQGYFELPWNTSSPQISEYVQVELDVGLPVNIYCYPNDPRACLMYDYNGNAAGIQITFLEQDEKYVEGYNFASVNSFTKVTLFNQTGWGFRVYFTDPTTLTTAGRTNTREVVEGVWVYLNGTLYNLPRPEPDPSVPNFGPFYRQGCMPGMGEHYFYNTYPGMDCSHSVLFYPLYQGGGLVGFGIAVYGHRSSLNRQWFENPPVDGIRPILTHADPCVFKYAEMNDLTSMHVYYVDHPWQMTCPA